jgi:hypothetical protein
MLTWRRRRALPHGALAASSTSVAKVHTNVDILLRRDLVDGLMNQLVDSSWMHAWPRKLAMTWRSSMRAEANAWSDQDATNAPGDRARLRRHISMPPPA